MNLKSLLPEVLASFSMSKSAEVLYTKDGELRDVVTSLDLRLHSAAQSFAENSLPPLQLCSEEGSMEAPDLSGNLLIVDPLDGSNNFALGLRDFGFMGCVLKNRIFFESLIVIPEENVYFSWSPEELLFSRAIKGAPRTSAPVYLAYPPSLERNHSLFRVELIDLVDSSSSGFYRSGSACLGLYRLITGQHSAFVGLNVRLWDVIAYFPVLKHLGFHIIYRIEEFSISVFVSRNLGFMEEISRLWSRFFDTRLTNFEQNQQIDWNSFD